MCGLGREMMMRRGEFFTESRRYTKRGERGPADKESDRGETTSSSRGRERDGAGLRKQAYGLEKLTTPGGR